MSSKKRRSSSSKTKNKKKGKVEASRPQIRTKKGRTPNSKQGKPLGINQVQHVTLGWGGKHALGSTKELSHKYSSAKKRNANL